MGQATNTHEAPTLRVFLHTPPVSRRGRQAPKRGQPPYPNAPRHECSVYFFWWEFLRCDPGYAEFCKQGGKGRGATKYRKLYSDFGDVHAMSFLAWWDQRGMELFAEPAERVARRLMPGEAATADPDVAVLSIPLSLSLRKINNRVKHLLRTELLRVKGGQRSQARYPVASRPALTSLYKSLRVHREHSQHSALYLYQIADRLGIQNANLRHDKRAQRIWQTNEVARQLRVAQRLIENVVQGKFPVTKPQS